MCESSIFGIVVVVGCGARHARVPVVEQPAGVILLVAVCPELNVLSFGDTTDEALASLQEAVTLFPEECQRMGTLESVLEQAGYQ
jgi:predicted RNase H-like HicB family nuclease